MNKHGRKNCQALVEERRHYALTLSYTLKNHDALLSAVNAEGYVRHWGEIGKRQLLHDLEKARGNHFARQTPQEKYLEFGARNAMIDQMEMTIEKMVLYIQTEKPKGFEYLAAISQLFKMQKDMMEFRGWNLSKKHNFLADDLENPRKLCHLFHDLGANSAV